MAKDIAASSNQIDAVQKFYDALLIEFEQAGYDDAEKSLLAHKRLYYGRYLNPGLRPYCIETVIPSIAQSLPFLIGDERRPHILDLGCGLGMQSIILASQGAKVTALDIREKSIELCKKRQTYYEEQLQTKLDIEFVHGDFLAKRAEDFATQFDSLFSMAAFSGICPVEQTVTLVSKVLKSNAKIFLYETNLRHPFKILSNSSDPSPASTVAALEQQGFAARFKYGTCALPGIFWRSAWLNQAAIRPANNFLTTFLPLSFNYVVGMQRGSG